MQHHDVIARDVATSVTAKIDMHTKHVRTAFHGAETASKTPTKQLLEIAEHSHLFLWQESCQLPKQIEVGVVRLCCQDQARAWYI